jgi:colanic acid biosynthesis glycosyl transferase WcaI
MHEDKKQHLRILTIHRFFWPDTPPYASILRTIADSWIADGHSVRVFSAQPSYKIELDNRKRLNHEQLGGLEVLRCWLFPERSRNPIIRGINSLLFCLRVFVHILLNRRQYDVVMCSTVPPIIMGCATSIAAWLIGAQFVYHAMDIWPEVAVHTGLMKTGWWFQWLRWLDTQSCRRAASVICLSEDMRHTYIARDPRLAKTVRVIDHFELPDYSPVETVNPMYLKRPGMFRVLFAGNIGRYQALDSIIDAADQLRNEKHIEFVFLGEGAAKASLQQHARGMIGQTVTFIPHQTVGVAKQLIADADLCVVSLATGIIRVAFPCKTISYLAMGRPLLVMVESDSQLSRLVRDHDLGVCCQPGETDLLAAQVLKLSADRQRLQRMSENCFKIAHEHMTPEAILPHWSNFIREFAGRPKVLSEHREGNASWS